VSQEEADAGLGQQLATYLVNARRVLVASAWGIVLGAVCALIGIAVAVHIVNEHITIYGPNYLVGVPLGFSLLLPLGLARGSQALLHLGESYAVHENGFLYRTRRREVAVSWADVLAVRTRGEEAYRGWRMWFGLGFSGRIRCAAGLTLRVDGMTDAAEVFCADVSQHLAAYRDGAAPVASSGSLSAPGPAHAARPGAWRRTAWITASVIAWCAGLGVLVVVVAHGTAGTAGSGTSPANDAYPAATTKGLVLTLSDPARAAVTDSVFSPDGKSLATCDAAGTAYLWSAVSGKRVATFRSGSHSALHSVTFSPDGTTLAAAGGTRGTYVWVAASGRQVATLADPKSAGAAFAAFAPDGKTLAVADANDDVYLWNTGTWTRTATLADPGEGALVFATFSPDGRTLAVIDQGGNIDLWDVAARRLAGSLIRLPEATAGAVSFSPDGRSLAVSYGDGTTAVWDLPTRKVGITTAAQDPSLAGVPWVTAVFSPDGKTLAAGFPDGSTSLFDASSGNLKSTLIDPGAQQDFGPEAQGYIGTTSAAFSPDGTRLASSGGSLGATFVWQLPLPR
jgi:WD40 repeat protein